MTRADPWRFPFGRHRGVFRRNSAGRAPSKATVLASRPMKLGVRLLLLVAVLLPFRGAMAVAAGLCHADMRTAEISAAAQAGHHDQGAQHHAHDDLQPAPEHRAGPEGGGDQGHGTSGLTCNFCAAVCGAPPLPTGSVTVHALLPTGAERFAAGVPPCPSAAFGAPERPPRTI